MRHSRQRSVVVEVAVEREYSDDGEFGDGGVGSGGIGCSYRL